MSDIILAFIGGMIGGYIMKFIMKWLINTWIERKKSPLARRTNKSVNLTRIYFVFCQRHYNTDNYKLKTQKSPNWPSSSTMN
ncbi:hypothetical protein BW153_08095 [Lactococcus lactis]|nr:hypothetical protein BW153_08095 [Lactococcus lactis]